MVPRAKDHVLPARHGRDQTEKSTVDRGKLNAVSSSAAPVISEAIPAPARASSATSFDISDPAEVPLACSIDNPDCEACQ